MMAQTDPSQRCPACDADIEHGSPRCVLCKSDLETWWPLEEAIQKIDEPTPPAALVRYAIPVVIVATLWSVAIGSAAYWVMTREPERAETVRQPGATAGPSTAPQNSGTPAPTPEPVQSPI